LTDQTFVLIVVDGVALRFLHRFRDGFVVSFGESVIDCC